MAANNVEAYVQLIKSFLEKMIDVEEFERRYLSMFKSDTSSWTEPEFEALNGLFAEVDAFCADPELRDENDIDEDQLREAASATLARLQ
jgi:hypothetical protein